MNIKKPLVWASTLFFAEGIPHVVLVTLAVVMYLQLGMSDTQIAFYTGWLCLPWVLRPLYRPFIELYQTRRWWVLAMQMLLGSALAGVAFTLNGSFWVQGTMFFFLLMAFSSATYGIAANDYCRLEMGDEDRSWYVGMRNTFYNIAIILGKGLLVPAAGILQVLFRNQKIYTWSLIFFGLAGIFIAFWLYHGLVLPRQTSAEKHSAKVIRNGMHDACFAFRHSYSVKELTVFLLFLFFFCLPEGMLFKMSDTFLLRPGSAGGLGLSPQEYGLASGTVGVIGLITGGIVGRMLIRRNGLQRWLWLTACAVTLPKAVYVYLSYALPENVWLVSACIYAEQLGCGFGYAAFTACISHMDRGVGGKYCRDICKSIGYLGLMICGMMSGYVKDMLGFRRFFIVILMLCAVTFAMTWLIKTDIDFGKKTDEGR